MSHKKLIFVYNAKSGRWNAALDIMHKIISPKTYKCELCTLTHDTFSENSLWKEFRESVAIETEFLHHDEFEKKYDAFPIEYPAILESKNLELSFFLKASEIKVLNSTEAFIQRIKDKIKTV